MPEEKNTYPMEITGLPPLEMVLVHIRDGRGTSTMRLAPGPVHADGAAQDQAALHLIVRLIEHLKESS
jgi:hypothetical protein